MDKTHNLLWTSGWDSTFRLLQLLFLEKVIVQPIYVIDKNRRSLNQELETIDKIVSIINEKFPNSKDLIKPVWYVEKKNLNENPIVSNAFNYIKSFQRIGSQYEWLAQFCHNHNLKNVELSVERNLDLTSFGNFLKENYLEIIYEESKNKELFDAIYTVFNYFDFPIIYLLKTDMLKITKENEWEEIMNLTWFCHKPKNNKPCGKCITCIATIEKGLSYRIPFKNRLKGYFKIYIVNKFK